MKKKLKKSDFWYDLPEALIAQTPIEPRDHSRLMYLPGSESQIKHLHFYDLLVLLHPVYCLILNVSRVLPPRLHG